MYKSAILLAMVSGTQVKQAAGDENVRYHVRSQADCDYIQNNFGGMRSVVDIGTGVLTFD